MRRAGPWPVQLRQATTLTSAQYVSEEGWRQATLEVCPLHPEGGCGFSRHGSYARRSPEGMRVARYYCPRGQMTFSLLPDCLCARLGGSLDEAEEAVVSAEERGVAAAVRDLRVDQCELPGAVRWLARRRRGVKAALVVLMTAMPGQLGTVAEVRSMREILGTGRALVALREIAAEQLAVLPAPLGFCRGAAAVAKGDQALQHPTGPDPP